VHEIFISYHCVEIYDEEAINNFNKSDYRNKKKRKRMEPIRSVIDQSIHAQADLGDESSRMVITKRVFVGNSDKFLSKGDYEEHLWVVYVRGANNVRLYFKCSFMHYYNNCYRKTLVDT